MQDHQEAWPRDGDLRESKTQTETRIIALEKVQYIALQKCYYEVFAPKGISLGFCAITELLSAAGPGPQDDA